MSKNSTKEEIEVIFLDVNKDKLEEKLESIGAEKIKDIFYRHVAMDYPDYRLNKDNSWIRLRDDGEAIKLAYKRRLGVTSQDGTSNDEGMEEVEVVVSDYEETKSFFKKIGLIEKHEAEKKRSRWQKGSIIFDIDTWPEISTFLEIEANSWEDIEEAVELLGFNYEDKKICSVNQIYRLYNMDVNDYQKIGFDKMVKKNDLS
jgi:adenylate cyclase class 2